MRLGAAGATALARLFTDDAVSIEPFSGGDGHPRTHIGRDVIVEFFRDSANHRPSDMVVTMNRLDAEGQRVRAEWTCAASVLAEPMRGVDLYTLRDGRIACLGTTLLTTRSR